MQESEDIISSDAPVAISNEDEPAEESLVDGILSSLSFIFEDKAENGVITEIEEVKKTEDTVSDILGGLSFLN